MRLIKAGATSQSIYVEILDSTSTTGGRKTGLAFNTSSLTAYYCKNGAAPTAITLVTLAANNSAFSSGGFKEIDATNMPGIYRLDIPDAAISSGPSVVVTLKGATGMVQVSVEIQLVAYDPQDATALGLSRIDAAISSRSTYAGGDTSGTTTLLARIGAAITITSGKVEVNDKTGFALTAGEHTSIASDAQAGLTAQGFTATRAGYLDTLNGLVQAIWDKATSAITTVGSIGKLIKDNLDAAISTRSTYAGADTSGTTTLLGRLTSTRAGLLDNLDATVSSRLASGAYSSPPSAASIADAVWDEDITTHANVDSAGQALQDAGGAGTPPTVIEIRQEMDANSTKLAHLDADISTRLATSGYTAPTTPPTVGAIRAEIDSNSTKLDVAVSTRLASAGYTAPDNTSITAIKTKTDQLNFTGTDVKATLDGESVTATVDEQAIADAVLDGLGSVADPLLNTVPGSYASGTAGAAIGRLVAASVTVSAPVYGTGQTMRIIRGDDYKTADGRSLDFSGTSWPDLTGATVQLTISKGPLTVTGTVVTPTGTALVRFELTATETNTLKPTIAGVPYSFDVEATLANGSIVTLVDSGKCTVVSDTTRP